MPRTDAAIVMAECWDSLPEVIGECPYTLATLVETLRSRGFSNFAYIKRHDE